MVAYTSLPSKGVNGQNPVLASAREMLQFPKEFDDWLADILRGIDDLSDHIHLFQSAPHVEHARRVLSRIERLRSCRE